MSARSRFGLPALTLVLVSGCIALALAIGSADAAPEATHGTITVTTGIDEFGTNLAACGLREAIESANTQADFGGCTGASAANTIILPAGNYTLTRSGASAGGNSIGDLNITSAITLNGVSAQSSVIRAGGAFTNRLLSINLGAVTVISGVKFTGANADIFGSGAGININSNTTLRFCEVSDNSVSDNFGGGIRVSQPGARVTIDSCIIKNNHADEGGGGIAASGHVTLSNSIVSGNTSDKEGGGALFQSSADGLIDRSTISGNTSLQRGGGVAIIDTARLRMMDATISSNTAPDSGGLHVAGNGLSMVGSSVLSNTATSAAGMRVTGTLATLVNSTVSGNAAQAGQVALQSTWRMGMWTCTTSASSTIPPMR